MREKEPPLSNPFKHLDKTRFRDAREPGGDAPEKIKKPGRDLPRPAPDNAEDLFSALMAEQGVTKLARSRTVAGAGLSAGESKAGSPAEAKPGLDSLPLPPPGQAQATPRQVRPEGPAAKEATLLTLGEHSAFAFLRAQAENLPQQQEKPAPEPWLKATLPEKSAPAPQPSKPEPPAAPGQVSLPPSWAEEALGPENDAAIFAQAMHGVRGLDGSGREVPLPPPVAKPAFRPKPVHPLQEFMEGKIEFSLEFSEEYLEGHVKGLDSQVINKMKAGGYSYEAHLDLHGLNAAQAWDALVGFFRSSYHKGHRCVLVVPGRGLNSPGGNGVLRERLQTWFTKEPFKYAILAFSTARPKDGGAGALYVLLRKQKKSRGKIAWEIIPPDAELLD